MGGRLDPAEQARIVRSLVERVVVEPGGADIRLRVMGLAALAPVTLRAAAWQPHTTFRCGAKLALGPAG
jgi:hypothetical protein